MHRHSDDLRSHAQELRRNMTPQEYRLWYQFMKNRVPNWKRQAVFEPFIVDFYCPAAKLAVELDGGQHFEEENIAKDAKRTAFLKEFYHLEVIRFSNSDVNNNFYAVCNAIADMVELRLQEMNSR